MSGKSRRRGRRLSRSQRKKVGRVVTAPVVEPAAKKTAPAPQVAVPAVRTPAANTAVQPESSSVSGELKRIGVVGGIMVALLVVAYFVLPLILD